MREYLSLTKKSFRSFFLFLFVSPLMLKAQTVLINPAAEGGFELGTTFADNGWTVATTGPTNQWVIGTVPAGFTNQSAYISNDGGISWSYTNTAISVVHFWRDVTFPAGETNIQLSFNWRALGETGSWDALMVSVAPTSFTPTASTISIGTGTLPAPAVTLQQFWNASTVQTANLTLPASLIGNCSVPSTRRLIFTWKNDGSGGSSPPAAVDNISLISSSVSPSPNSGPFTINNTLPTVGTNFNNFTDAINWLNAAAACASGPIVFNVSAGQIFTENPPIITATGTAAAPITFQKAGAGLNPQIQATGGAGATDAAICVSGGDYFTFDGIDVSVTGGSALEYGYLIRNASAVNGASFNTIRNCRIILNRTNVNTIGVLVTSSTTGGGITPTNADGTSSDNTIQSVIVEDSYGGIQVNNGSTTFFGNNNVVTGTIANPTVIGTNYTTVPPGNIGGGSAATYGIWFQNQSNYTISHTIVQNITATTGIIRGIQVVGGRGNGTISHNIIRGLRRNSTTSTAVVHGLDLAFNTTTGFVNTMDVFNNMLSDITSTYTGVASATRALKGIILGSGNATSTYNIFHNSVSIDGSGSPNLSNICLEHGGTITTNNVRNNIFANFTGAQSGVAKHYVVRSTAANQFGAVGSVSNNNNYFIANATNGFVGLLNTTDAATLAAWTAGLTSNPGTDLNSINANPNFLDNNIDLHLNPSIPTQMESGGAQLNVLDDIDGDIRQGQPGYVGTGTAPDLGADEGNFILLDLSAPIISYSPLSFTCSPGDRTFEAIITDATGVPTTGTFVPRVYYNKNAGPWFSSPGTLASGTATNGTWNFTIVAAHMGGLATGDVVNYYVIAQDSAPTPNIASNPPGAVASDVNTVITHPASALSYTINSSLSGTYTVGVGGDFPTLTAAAAAYNSSCIAGPVVFSLTDFTYPSETLPITFNHNPFASSVNTLTIRPAAGNTPTISGSSATSVIRLLGADFITIDGSNNGTDTRDLTISNTNASTSSSVIWIGNTVTPLNAALSNTIKNTKLEGNAPTTTVAGVIISSGATAGAAAEVSNSHNSVINNTIVRVQNGVFAIGNVATPDQGWNISQNTIGSAVPADFAGFRGIAVQNAQGFTVSGNDISGVVTATSSTASGILVAGVISGGAVVKNRITNVKNTNTVGWGSNGIFLNSGTANTGLLVANNFISDVASYGFSGWGQGDNGYGIIINAGGGYQIYNNTINLATDQTSTSGNTAAINIFAGTGHDIRNNIFVNAQTIGNRYAIYSGVANTSFTAIDFNDYVSSGGIGFLATPRNTLADWQTATGQDANSVNINPVFVSGTDLHLPPASNIALIDLATVIPSVTDDIDGQLRGTTPDMGADEFADYPQTPPTPQQDPNPPSCATGTFIFVTGTPEPGVEWYWQTVPNGTNTDFPATSNYTVTLNGTYYLRAYNSTLNLWSVNSSSITVSNIATTPIAISPAGPITICQGDPLTLSVTGLPVGPQQTITQWNFNNQDLIPNVGSGTALNIGGTSQTFFTGTGSSDPVQPGYGWSTSNYPAQSTNNKSAGTQFNVSTAGYKNIIFSFDIRLSNTAANTYVVQYNPAVNNPLSPWIDAATFTYTTAGSFINNQTVDLSSFPAANNNPNLGVRIVSAFDGMSGQYTGVASSYGTSGTVRLDMVTFKGDEFNYGFLWNTGDTTESINPTQTGMYSVVVTAPSACPGLDSVFVTVNPTYAITINPQICDNQTYTLPDNTVVNTAGLYVNNFTTVNGCDSVIVVNLTVNPTYNTTVNPVICSNQTYTLANGNQVTAPGTYTVTVPAVTGCDSTVTANLTVLPAQLFNVNAEICAGQSYTLPDGSSVSTAGTYTNVFQADNGCDSTIVTNLTVKPVYTTVLNPVICANQTYTMPDGSTQDQAGTYVFPYTAVNGCDSTFTVNLTVNPIFTTNVSADICPGQFYTLANGNQVNATGVYTVTVPAVTGCDSTVTVDLTVRSNYNNVFNASICQGQTYTLANGVNVTQAGTYTVGVASIYGCDSIVTVNLTVKPVYTQTVSASICQGQTYQLPDGETATTAGNYTSVLQTVDGCDSTIITNLTVNPLPFLNLGADLAVLNPPVVLNAGAGAAQYLWNTGAQTQTITVTQNGTYSVTVTNSFGCSASDTVSVFFTASVASLGSNGASVNIFPNPADLRFTLSVNGYNDGGDLQLDILNAVGKVVKAERLAGVAPEFNHVVDVADLAPGTYLVRIRGTKAESTVRLIIAK